MGAAGDAFARFVDVLSSSLDEPAASSDDLAARLHLSRSQLDRVVTAVSGESPGRFRRRVLLERAAFRLVATGASILDVGVEAGYSSHEAFTRAFQRAFAATPSAWRSEPGDPRLPTPNGVHFHPPGALRLPARTEVTHMDLLVSMTEHHIWLTGQLVDASERLSPETLNLPIPRYVGSVTDRPTLRSLLSRLVGQLDMWNQAVANRPYDFSIEHDESLDSMRARLARCGPVYLAQVRDACEQGRLGDTFVDTTGGPPTIFTYGAMVAHVLTYAAYRRTLAVDLLEAAGITVDGDDPLDWPPLTPEGQI